MTKQNDTKAEGESKEVANTLQSKLAEKMMGVFELVVSDRSGHFAKHPGEIPDKKSVPSIINSYSVTNAAISGGASLVPGPWGMVAVIPEIAVVIRNQLAMIYDVGMAYGKSKVLNKELLAGVLLTALGSSAGSLAVWSNYLTRQVGKKAIEIFEKEIVLSEEVIEEMSLETESVSVPTATSSRASTPSISPEMPKVQTLVNLLKVDGTIKAEEREYMQTIIGNADLTESEKADLTQAIDKSGKFVVDYSAFASSPDDAIGLLVDMVTLAKRDGTFHITEKMFVKQVGKLLGFSDNDIDETMATTG